MLIMANRLVAILLGLGLAASGCIFHPDMGDRPQCERDADCVEYGQWKLGHRNNAVTFAIQPFINKVGGALAQAILGATLIATGINGARTPADVTPQGIWGMKAMMMIFPTVIIAVSYFIYRRKFVIDEALHAKMVADLRAKGQLELR